MMKPIQGISVKYLHTKISLLNLFWEEYSLVSLTSQEFNGLTYTIDSIECICLWSLRKNYPYYWLQGDAQYKDFWPAPSSNRTMLYFFLLQTQSQCKPNLYQAAVVSTYYLISSLKSTQKCLGLPIAVTIATLPYSSSVRVSPSFS